MVLRDGAGLTDGQLLESFVGHKDQAAFEALVRRHGPMVLGVCRRVLRNHHDAEDAFQATFIVLVRKASSILPRAMLPNWLYGVAYRTALRARGMIAKQRVRERHMQEMPEPEAEAEHCWHDIQPVLDQELSRLPDKYRMPIILCDLEGKTGKEVARQFGWPEGTVASRLSRGRDMLAKRLTRHGLMLSGGSLTAVFSQNSASASVPTPLVSSTIKAASLLAAGQALTTGLISTKVAALTEGVLKAMLLSKLKITLVLCAVVGVVGSGLGGISLRAIAKEGWQSDQRVAMVDGKTPTLQERQQDAAESDLEKLQGTWRVISSQVGDEKAEADEVARRKVTVKGDLLIYDYGNEQKDKQEGTIKLDPKTKAFDWTWTFPQQGATMLGIYELKGDDLRICFGNDGLVRPRQFVIGKEDVVWLLVLKREKAE